MRKLQQSFFKTTWSSIMDDFRRKPVNKVPLGSDVRPVTPVQTPSNPVEPAELTNQQSESIAPQPLDVPTGITTPAPKKSKMKRIIWIIVSLLVVLLAAAGTIFAWYTTHLSPVDSSDSNKRVVKIEAGSTPSIIADTLKENGVIRDQTAFLWYTRIKGVQNSLQAGSYRLAPSESTPQIVEHLSNGKVDTFSITFLPGATLEDNRKAFIAAGYSEEEVDTGLAKTYDSPLFEGKPANADLEGYIYGETYTFGTDTTVEAILEHVFEEYYSVIKENNLVAAFAAKDFTLYQGITLASIIQREASPKGDDMPQIAQVFYSRLAIDMPLGSDVTYQYIADKLGVQRSTDLDSHYNTRRYAGLPPGPISVPGKKALLAVANPASGDYLYFLSGDDNITYFARTNAEHEANIRNHCQEKCQII